MNFLKRIGISGQLNRDVALRGKIDSDLKKDKKKRLSNLLVKERLYLADEGQAALKQAIEIAENPDDPNRYLLYGFYKEAMRDLHLRSQIRTAINEVLEIPWAVVDRKTKQPNEELTELLQKQWFDDVCNYALEAEFWGHSLIELGQLVQQEGQWVFENVSLIDRWNVCPEKGYLLIRPNDHVGLPFREAPFDQWLLEVGNPHNLGLLGVCAKHSIYKKYGLGDWSRSIERWGDPLLHIGTSSDDDGENRKKEDFARNFGKNGWVMTDEEDKVNILDRKFSDGYKIFQDFVTLNNDENSKGVNGQTGTSDQKAYVGAAEVQERVLKGYTISRLRKLSYFINDKLFPKITQSWEGKSAYKALEGYKWMPLISFTDPRQQSAEPDEEPKPTPTPTPNSKPTPTRNSTPKPNSKGGQRLGKPRAGSGLHTILHDLYQPCDDGCTHDVAHHEVLNIDLDKVVKRAMDKIYKRKIKPGYPDHELILQQAEGLWEGVKRGFEKDLPKLTYGSYASRLYVNMKYNVHVFATFKVHQNASEIHSLLFDEDGKIKPRHRFIKDARQVNDKYFKAYYEAEYDTAVGKAQMAGKWAKYKDRGGYFTYRTVGDGRVRPSHKLLEGATYAVDHPFWRTYFPPNDWRCRCSVSWHRSAAEKDPEGLPDLKKIFQNNPGIQQKVFDENHPYFELDADFLDAARKLFGYKPPVDLDKFTRNQVLHRDLMENDSYVKILDNAENGGFVFRHTSHKGNELKDNETTGKVLANERGDGVILQEVTNTGKSPDAIVNNVVTDFKVTTTDNLRNSFNNHFKGARAQGVDNLYIRIDKGYRSDKLERALQYAFRSDRNQRIKEVTLIIGGKLMTVTREDYTDGIIRERVK